MESNVIRKPRRIKFTAFKKPMQDGDNQLEATRTKLASLLIRHEDLAERCSRDSDRTIFERLMRDFEDARASQTGEVCLNEKQWNDGLLATLREQVHMEAERKAKPGHASISARPQGRITYKIGNKMICRLEGSKIGIQYQTSFAGESCELYHCVLESKSFLEKMTVLEHSIPFFLPIHEAEKNLLSSSAKNFIDHVGDLLQAYVDKREQVRLIKELYGDQITGLYHSLPLHIIDFVRNCSNCKVTVSLRYADFVSASPTQVCVLGWPRPQFKKNTTNKALLKSQLNPIRLTYAEHAFQTMSLPEAYAEFVLKLREADLEQKIVLEKVLRNSQETELDVYITD